MIPKIGDETSSRTSEMDVSPGDEISRIISRSTMDAMSAMDDGSRSADTSDRSEGSSAKSEASLIMVSPLTNRSKE